MERSRAPAVLVTGATGYIGGRLVPRLLAAGWQVRCLVRSPHKLRDRSWARHPGLTILDADLDDTAAVAHAAAGCSAAFWLVHSMMAAGSAYAAIDLRLARSFANAMSAAGVARILYLGGLGSSSDSLSEHLRSRRDVELALRSTAVPVTVLRAAMIIGSGSSSFEILRYLVDRLPIMLTPRWVRTKCQPIAIEDVLHYLVRCLHTPETAGRTLDIGGPDVLDYRALMQLVAAECGLPRRLIVPLPVLTPRLSALWIHLLTPLDARIARPLAEGLRNEVVCRDDDAMRLMPKQLLSARAAVAAAVAERRTGRVESHWSDAGRMPGDPDWAGGTLYVDRRELAVAAPAAAAWRAVTAVGGDRGWYGAGLLWRVRGALDRIVGGPGLRRGRRDPCVLALGDAVDFWRVTAVDAPSRLELRAEMRLPGVATLTFEIEPVTAETCVVRQTARFAPRGLSGLVYWAAMLPLHGFVFRRLLAGIARASRELAAVDRCRASAPHSITAE
jgi:uncharacterized protein YbjT (DUF2867 family)